MDALILEMYQSVFICVITSYTTLKSNPEKLQHMYQETTESICWRMSDLCFLCFTLLFYVSNLSRNKVLTTAQDGAIISCVDMLPQRQLFTVIYCHKLVILSECSELLKAIMLFLIKQFSSPDQRLLF